MAVAEPGDAIVYVRISRDTDREGLGVDRQEQACRELADRNGWRIVHVYVDNDRSAYQGKPRPDYLRMRADLAAGLAAGDIAGYHQDCRGFTGTERRWSRTCGSTVGGWR